MIGKPNQHFLKKGCEKTTAYFDPVPDDKAGITIHHLLTHQAGFPGSLGRDAEPITAEEYISRAMNAELIFTPGEEYYYSNTGYSLLGISHNFPDSYRYDYNHIRNGKSVFLTQSAYDTTG